MREVNILPWVVVLTSLVLLVIILTINTIHNNIIQKKEAMKEPTTIKGYIKLIRFIEMVSPNEMKGFDNLSNDDKDKLQELSAELSNKVNDIDFDLLNS